jgi:hypothetical protein
MVGKAALLCYSVTTNDNCGFYVLLTVAMVNCYPNMYCVNLYPHSSDADVLD